MFLEIAVLRGIGGELGADREELTLDPQDDGVPRRIGDQRTSGSQR